MRRWSSTAVLALGGLVIGGASVAAGSPVSGLGILVFFLVAALLVSPRAFPRSLTDEAARVASETDGRPIVYWRPGCPYCLRLRARLGRDARRLHWVDIWADPDGAASVREVTGGDETVPTVIAAERSFINPDAALVRGLLKPRERNR
jgi:glutaredoxin